MAKSVAPVRPAGMPAGGFWFAATTPADPAVDKASAKPQREPKVKTRRVKKNDPRLVAAARELRDRWLEQLNATPLLSCGKYDVCRPIDGPAAVDRPATLRMVELIDMPALPAPIAA